MTETNAEITSINRGYLAEEMTMSIRQSHWKDDWLQDHLTSERDDCMKGAIDTPLVVNVMKKITSLVKKVTDR